MLRFRIVRLKHLYYVFNDVLEMTYRLLVNYNDGFLSNLPSSPINLLTVPTRYYVAFSLTNGKLCSDTSFKVENDIYLNVLGVIGVNVRRSLIEHLCVHREFRRRGVGSELVKHVLLVLKEDKDYVRTYVKKDNFIGLNFFTKLGFIIIGKTESSFLLEREL